VGGTLISDDGNDWLFGQTQRIPGRLVLETVPEPSTGLLVPTGLIGLVLRRASLATPPIAL
jgi:PEP-CTERM motif-containing protein